MFEPTFARLDIEKRTHDFLTMQIATLHCKVLSLWSYIQFNLINHATK